MTHDNWYQVKYDADGNVIEVLTLAQAGLTSPEVVTSYTAIANAVDAEDTVLYYETLNIQNLEMISRTLFVNTKAETGFRVASDVNIALIQYNNNDKKTYFETGSGALENIVDELNDRHDGMGTHNYTMNAILEDGIATSIVINDALDSSCDPYTRPNWGTPSRDIASVAFTADGSFRLVDSRNNNITTGTFKYELQESGIGGYKTVQSGTVNAATDTFPTVTGFFASAMENGESYRLVVDGVPSEIIAVPVTPAP